MNGAWEPRLEGLLGAGREVVFSEIYQEWLVLMQEENRLLRKADEEQERSGRGAVKGELCLLRWRPRPTHRLLTLQFHPFLAPTQSEHWSCHLRSSLNESTRPRGHPCHVQGEGRPSGNRLL